MADTSPTEWELFRYGSRLTTEFCSTSYLYVLAGVVGRPDSRPCVYTTPNRYDSSSEARSRVGVTHLPVFRALLEYPESVRGQSSLTNNFHPSTNMGRALATKEDARRAPRVWPAFGNSGGAREVIMVDPKGQSCLSSLETLRLPVPCPPEPYVQDMAQAFSADGLRGVVDGTWDLLREVDPERPPEIVSGKLDDHGLALAWEQGERMFSVSMAFLVDRNDLFLRIWGATWTDTEIALGRKPSGYCHRLCLELEPSSYPLFDSGVFRQSLQRDPSQLRADWSLEARQKGSPTQQKLRSWLNATIESLRRVTDSEFLASARPSSLRDVWR